MAGGARHGTARGSRPVKTASESNELINSNESDGRKLIDPLWSFPINIGLTGHNVSYSNHSNDVTVVGCDQGCRGHFGHSEINRASSPQSSADETKTNELTNINSQEFRHETWSWYCN